MSKIILTNEVSGLGSAGDVVEVKNGYARNYLLPRGFAVIWSKGGERQVSSIRAARAEVGDKIAGTGIASGAKITAIATSGSTTTNG